MKLQVLLPKVFNFPFTYNIDQKKNFKKGDIVEVPFGSKKEIGVIWDNVSSTSKKIKIKNINKKIENFNINEKLINYIEWFSMYNMVPRGLALKMCIGSGKNFVKQNDKIEKEKIIKITKYSLNIEQKKSLKFLESTHNKFNVSVLQGTTGSGKTIVYFERIKKIIKENTINDNVVEEASENNDNIVEKLLKPIKKQNNIQVEWVRVQIKETTEVNGVRFPSGIQIDVTDEDAQKMIEGGKAILLEDLVNKENP